MVAAIVGAVAVSAVALVGVAVTAIVGLFGESISLSEATRRTAYVGGGIAACAAMIASAWAAAYASTQEGSRWRMLAGSSVGIAFGLGLVGIGSLGAPGAAVAAAWGMAIPADRMGRATLRSVPMALVALVPVLQAREGWLQWVVAGVAGLAAAWLWLAMAEGIWSVLRKIASTYGGESAIMQSKTQVDERKRASKPVAEGDLNAEEEPWRTST